MRYLVISDLHANYVALEAVLDDSAGKWDEILCLGDLVGYGPQPNECVDRLTELPVTAVPGNHDWAVLGRFPLEYFNEHARTALEWTRPRLHADTRDYLGSLKPLVLLDGITLFHGSLTGYLSDYVLNPADAAENFALLETPVGLFGHSHLCFYFSQSLDGEVVTHPLKKRNKLDLQDRKSLLNPGSVGQPRGGDPRAAWGILDTEKGLWLLCRTAYDVHAVQQLMRRHGLPDYLIRRLAAGR